MSYTKGPWTTSGQGGMERKKDNGQGVNRWQNVGLESGRGIAEVFLRSGKWNDPEGQANARLIAASPELLEAAKAALARFQEDHCDGHHAQHPATLLEAAIAKAKGGEGTHNENA